MAPRADAPVAIVTLTSDFGTRDTYVGAMKGALLSIDASLSLIDLTHHIPFQDILGGSYALRQGTDRFPPDTVHLAVVDPGVGSERRGIAIDDGRHRWVGPDNGLFSHVLRQRAARVHQLTNPDLQAKVVSPTFHGRDIFAPAAAHLATGLDVSAVGPVVDDAICLAQITSQRQGNELVGSVLHVDHFGNLITSVTTQDVQALGAVAQIVIGRTTITGLSVTYTDADPGQPMGLIGSGGHLEVSVRGGHAARELDVGVGATVTITGTGPA